MSNERQRLEVAFLKILLRDNKISNITKENLAYFEVEGKHRGITEWAYEEERKMHAKQLEEALKIDEELFLWSDTRLEL